MEARCQRLKAEQANQAYRKMVEDVDTKERLDRSTMRSFGKESRFFNDFAGISWHMSQVDDLRDWVLYLPMVMPTGDIGSVTPNCLC